MRNCVVLLLVGLAGVNCVQFRLKNNRGDEIWVGIQGGNGNQPLEGGGFKLNGNEEKTIDSPDDWEGRFWARTGCNGGPCQTGDCGNGELQCSGRGGTPPVTLAEIKLKGDGGQDFYDISLVDGFNVQATIQPEGGEGDCPALGCNADVNAGCPDNLKQSVDGNTVGCKSSCLAFNTDQYCCRNDYNSAESCNINDWEVKSAQYFKSQCPDAYSYAYDDSSSLKTCKASTYLITFG